MNTPLISIIMANNNRAKYIRQAVESVNKQTYSNWELIINDDGSTDNSVEEIKKLAYGNPKIKTLFSTEQRGVGLTHRESVQHAKGKYIAVLDSDDYITDATLALFVDYLECSPEIGVAYSKLQLCEEDGNLKDIYYGGNLYSQYDSYAQFAATEPHGSLVSALRVFRKSIYDKTSGYGPYKNAIEKDLLLKLEEAGAKFGFIDLPLYKYRRHPESIGATKRHDCMPEIIKAHKKRTTKPPSEPSAVKSAKRPVLLQYNNVAWVGGTLYTAIDLANYLDEYHHVIVYRHDSKHTKAIQRAKNCGIEIFQAPTMTEKLIKSINPTAILMNNPGKGAYEEKDGKEYYDKVAWIKDYPLITWHHSPVHPWIPSRADIFCSEYLKGLYKNLLNRMEVVEVIPPCIKIPNKLGKAVQEATESHELEYIPKVFGIVDSGKVSKKNLEYIAEIISLQTNHRLIIADSKHSIKGRGIETLPNMHSLDNFYDQLHILIHFPDKPGTWERVITEAMARGIFICSSGKGGAEEQLREAPMRAFNKSISALHEFLVSPFEIQTLVSRAPMQQAHAAKVGGTVNFTKFRKLLTQISSGVI